MDTRVIHRRTSRSPQGQRRKALDVKTWSLDAQYITLLAEASQVKCEKFIEYLTDFFRHQNM